MRWSPKAPPYHQNALMFPLPSPPPAQNQYMQETSLGELVFVRIHAGPVLALTRIQENIFEDHFLHISRILAGIQFGANTCRACIRSRTNTGKYSWRIIYVLVSCQGVHFAVALQVSVNFCAVSLVVVYCGGWFWQLVAVWLLRWLLG